MPANKWTWSHDQLRQNNCRVAGRVLSQKRYEEVIIDTLSETNPVWIGSCVWMILNSYVIVSSCLLVKNRSLSSYLFALSLSSVLFCRLHFHRALIFNLNKWMKFPEGGRSCVGCSSSSLSSVLSVLITPQERLGMSGLSQEETGEAKWSLNLRTDLPFCGEGTLGEH